MVAEMDTLRTMVQRGETRVQHEQNFLQGRGAGRWLRWVILQGMEAGRLAEMGDLAGYGGRVVAEMDKLRTMARKTEDRQQLGELMALVAEKATVAVAVKPDRTDSKVPHL